MVAVMLYYCLLLNPQSDFRFTMFSMTNHDNVLHDWREQALAMERAIQTIILGQNPAIRLLMISVFARGHALLEGDVGVGKTTLLQALARVLGGAFNRVEGSVELLPNDLLYHAYIDESGRPRVEPGPLLRHDEELAVFFFNEINRARPQVHALLLRVMAERSVSAFNREYFFPYLLVFADRNRVEREETFELPSAARDRFMLEIPISLPNDSAIQRELMLNSRFHNHDELLAEIDMGRIDLAELSRFARIIQQEIHTSPDLEDYVLNLWRATHRPQDYGVAFDNADSEHLVLAGVSPRGASLLLRAARVTAWLDGRYAVLPQDIHTVFQPAVAHRIFLTPVYELRRETLIKPLIQQILERVSAP